MMPLLNSPDRADWLETMVYLANTLLPAMRDWFYASQDGDPTGVEAVTALARRRIEVAWDRLEARMSEGRSYLVGERLSTVDLLAIILMRWSRNMPARQRHGRTSLPMPCEYTHCDRSSRLTGVRG
jgi:glutathione S-transferase